MLHIIKCSILFGVSFYQSVRWLIREIIKEVGCKMKNRLIKFRKTKSKRTYSWYVAKKLGWFINFN